MFMRLLGVRIVRQRLTHANVYFAREPDRKGHPPLFHIAHSLYRTGHAGIRQRGAFLIKSLSSVGEVLTRLGQSLPHDGPHFPPESVAPIRSRQPESLTKR